MTNILTKLPEPLFFGVMGIVGIGWIALILFPRRHWANYWVAGVIIPGILGIVYTTLMSAYWFHPPEGNVKNFFSLPGAYEMFDNDGLLLAAWTDIVVLSLIAGAWITRKAAQLRISYAVLLPLLLVTFGFPGTGLVIFFIVCALVGRFRTLAELERAIPIPEQTG